MANAESKKGHLQNGEPLFRERISSNSWPSMDRRGFHPVGPVGGGAPVGPAGRSVSDAYPGSFEEMASEPGTVGYELRGYIDSQIEQRIEQLCEEVGATEVAFSEDLDGSSIEVFLSEDEKTELFEEMLRYVYDNAFFPRSNIENSAVGSDELDVHTIEQGHLSERCVSYLVGEVGSSLQESLEKSLYSKVLAAVFFVCAFLMFSYFVFSVLGLF